MSITTAARIIRELGAARKGLAEVDIHLTKARDDTQFFEEDDELTLIEMQKTIRNLSAEIATYRLCIAAATGLTSHDTTQQKGQK